mgnify:CR=1 FL=1
MILSNVKRHEKTNAVLNVDNTSLESYRAARGRDNKINSYIDKVEKLNEDVTEIKNMLKALVNGSKHI